MSPNSLIEEPLKNKKFFLFSIFKKLNIVWVAIKFNDFDTFLVVF